MRGSVALDESSRDAQNFSHLSQRSARSNVGDGLPEVGIERTAAARRLDEKMFHEFFPSSFPFLCSFVMKLPLDSYCSYRNEEAKKTKFPVDVPSLLLLLYIRCTSATFTWQQ